MISGKNSRQALLDMKYNITDEQLQKIVKVKKAIAEHEPAGKFLNGSFESMLLPSIMAGIDGNQIEDSYYKNASGEKNEILDNLSSMVECISKLSKFDTGTSLEKAVNGLYRKYQQYIVEDEESESNSESEMEEGKGEVTDAIDEAIKEAEKDKPKNTDSDNADGDDIEDPITDSNILKDMAGYLQLEKWLETIKGATSKKRKMANIKKTSDLQKVSAVEFVKPRGIFMKKLISRELQCRSYVPREKRMHVMTDNSGSMGDFISWRNQLAKRVFDDCKAKSISLESVFFKTSLCDDKISGPNKLQSYRDLRDFYINVKPGGGDSMGRCVVQKLKSMNRLSEKQYLLCISDGTGSISNSETTDKIYELLREKNVELKYALFSTQNEMHGTLQEDIFYIYD